MGQSWDTGHTSANIPGEQTNHHVKILRERWKEVSSISGENLHQIYALISHKLKKVDGLAHLLAIVISRSGVLNVYPKCVVRVTQLLRYCPRLGCGLLYKQNDICQRIGDNVPLPSKKSQ